MCRKRRPALRREVRRPPRPGHPDGRIPDTRGRGGRSGDAGARRDRPRPDRRALRAGASHRSPCRPPRDTAGRGPEARPRPAGVSGGADGARQRGAPPREGASGMWDVDRDRSAIRHGDGGVTHRPGSAPVGPRTSHPVRRRPRARRFAGGGVPRRHRQREQLTRPVLRTPAHRTRTDARRWPSMRPYCLRAPLPVLRSVRRPGREDMGRGGRGEGAQPGLSWGKRAARGIDSRSSFTG